jgi:DNA topoisomerase-1
MTAFTTSGINCIGDIAHVSVDVLQKAGLNEEEATTLKTEATLLTSKNKLKEAGVPAASLKKYQEAGFIGPEDLLASHPAYISLKTGVSIETVGKHITLIAEAFKAKPPVKISKKSFEKGREELLALKGLNESMLEQMYLAGIYDLKSLKAITIDSAAKASGISKDKIKQFKAAAPV